MLNQSQTEVNLAGVGEGAVLPIHVRMMPTDHGICCTAAEQALGPLRGVFPQCSLCTLSHNEHDRPTWRLLLGPTSP